MKVLGGIGFILAIIMVSLNLYPSWSQYARTLEEPLLLGCLWSISMAFMLRAQRAVNRDKIVVFKRYAVKDLDVITSVLFGAILCTPVTHEAKAIEIAHFIVTGLAIVCAYINLVLQQVKPKLKLLTKISFGLAFVAFPIGLLTHWYSVGIGELIVSIALLIHILATKTKR